jgi:hypothetical protein
MVQTRKTGRKTAKAKAGKSRSTKTRKATRSPARKASKVKRRKPAPAGDLKAQLARRTEELKESLTHQAATAEILQVIGRPSGDLKAVFDLILERATRICDAKFGLLLLFEAGSYRCMSVFNLPPAFAETFSRVPVISPPPTDPLGRLAATRQPVHVADVRQEPEYLAGFPPIVELAELGGARTLLLVPMLLEDALVGTIAICATGRSRHRKRSPRQRTATAFRGSERSAAATDRHGRRPEGDQPVGVRPADGAGYTGGVGGQTRRG